jgi:hypothetical protein
MLQEEAEFEHRSVLADPFHPAESRGELDTLSNVSASQTFDTLLRDFDVTTNEILDGMRASNNQFLNRANALIGTPSCSWQ